MLELGSTEIGKEIQAVAELRHEYANWIGKADRESVSPFEPFLITAVKRLRKAGQAKKVLELLELHRGASLLNGLSKGHPVIKSTDQLIALFGADANKPIESAPTKK